MAATHQALSGRITRNDNHQGIHGIRVEAWDATQAGDRPIGVALTNIDGSYHIDLPGLDCCDCPAIFIQLRDRDCRLIHDGCKDRRCCKPGEPLRVDVALAPQVLWWHLSRPLSWAAISEPLVPVRVMQEIEDALETLNLDPAALTLARCVTPPIQIFDNLLHDAWGTLQGDTAAARRYRDVLDLLCGTEERCCGAAPAFAAQVDGLFAGACDQPQPTHCEEPMPCAPCGPDECAEEACACEAPFIGDDKSTLLVMAALHVACGKEALARRYVQVLLGQLCRFETLGALHAAALQALLGDAAARVHARDLLELLCTLCGAQPTAALTHADWSTRLAAIDAAAACRDPKVVPQLIDRLAVESARLARRIADHLWQLTAQPFEEDAARWQAWWRDAGSKFAIVTEILHQLIHVDVGVAVKAGRIELDGAHHAGAGFFSFLQVIDGRVEVELHLDFVGRDCVRDLTRRVDVHRPFLDFGNHPPKERDIRRR